MARSKVVLYDQNHLTFTMNDGSICVDTIHCTQCHFVQKLIFGDSIIDIA